MPVTPPITVQAYNSVNDVLNIVRTRVNDELRTILPISGKVLANNHPFMQRVMNTAWRMCQKFLAEKGFSRLIDEVVIFNFPVVANQDPASQCWISWAGCSDSQNVFPQPALPQGFSHPLKIWERWTNQNAQFGDPPMEKWLDGFPSMTKTSGHRFWEWRNDAIYTPGSIVAADFRIRYTIFMPDFTDQGNTAWFMQPVPINGIDDAMAWFACSELANNDHDAQQYCITQAESAALKTFNLDVRADQRANVRRRPRSGRAFGRSWY